MVGFIHLAAPQVLSLLGRIGWGEIVLILGLALLIFGPRKLPELARSLGRSLREFKHATSNIQKDLEEGINSEDKPTKSS